MEDSVYRKLREQLDQYSVGFPTTHSGIEMKILRKLFTEDEAGIFLDMSLLLEESASVAKRTGRDEEKTAEAIENMAQKGLIFRKRMDDTIKYAAVPFLVGSYEFQVGRMDKEFAEMFEDYFKEALTKNISNVHLPLRTVPVHKSVDIGANIAPYRDAREIIEMKDNIALADCICRKQKRLLGEDCDNPREVCFMFGSHAEYYVENGLARKITQEEALSVIDKCEEAGLVCQPANSINPGGMCNCCGDCCGILRALKIQPKPSEMVVNNYWASVDPDICTGCETCVDRCQMEAVSINESDIAQINTDRCIGCGLCVTTCPSEAMSLVLKPEESRFEPPTNGRDLMQKTAQKRRKTLMPLSMSG